MTFSSAHFGSQGLRGIFGAFRGFPVAALNLRRRGEAPGIPDVEMIVVGVVVQGQSLDVRSDQGAVERRARIGPALEIRRPGGRVNLGRRRWPHDMVGGRRIFQPHLVNSLLDVRKVSQVVLCKEKEKKPQSNYLIVRRPIEPDHYLESAGCCYCSSRRPRWRCRGRHAGSW